MNVSFHDHADSSRDSFFTGRQTSLPMNQLKSAIVAAKTGDHHTARGLLLDLSRSQPDKELVWHWLAYVSEMPEEKAGYLERVLDLNPDNAKARLAFLKIKLKEGIRVFRNGNKIAAVDFFKQVISLDRNHEKAWLWLAASELNDSAREKALHEVLRINPENTTARAMLDKLAANKTTPAACPFCFAELNDSDYCNECDALLTLTDVDIFFKRPIPDRHIFDTAVKRLEARVTDFGGLEDSVNLALAYLNLQEVEKALELLVIAGSQQSENPELRQAIQYLKKKFHGRAALAKSVPLNDETNSLPSLDKLHGTNGTELDQGLNGFSADPVPALDSRAADPASLELAQQPAGDTVQDQTNPAHERLKIMIIDDSSTVRKLVSVTLSRQGYDVITASSGTEGLSRLNEVVPDLIFLDITMPKLDGYQVCRLIRSNQRTKDIPVCLLTGKDGFFDRVRGKIAGAREYIVKPFETATLIATIRKFCKA